MRDIYWRESLPNLHDGLFAVTWTLQHAIDINVGSVNGPIHMAVLETIKGKLEARLLEIDELAEHQQNIKAVKDFLRDFRENQQAPSLDGIPEVPKPAD